MEILRMILFGIIATFMIRIVAFNGGNSKAYGDLIRIVVTVIFLIFIISQLSSVYEIIRELAIKLHMDETYLNIVLKVVGIAYLAEFGTQLCEDAGEKAIGAKIQWAGKVMIFVMAAPVILALMEMVSQLI